MTKSRGPAIASLALLAAACTTSPRFDVMPRVGFFEIEGALSTRSTDGAASADTSAARLGLDDEAAFQPRFDLDWPYVHLTISGLDVEFEGTGATDAALDLGPISIEGEARVRSEFDIGLYTAMWTLNVLPTKFLDIGLGVGVGLLDYQIDVRSLNDDQVFLSNDYVPFAFPTLRVATQLGPVALSGLASAISGSFDGEELSYVDLDVAASVRLFSTDSGTQGYVTGGYRFIHVDYEYEDDGFDVKGDVDVKGPFAGVTIYL